MKWRGDIYEVFPSLQSNSNNNNWKLGQINPYKTTYANKILESL
jgi:hypothetical protein